MMTGLVDGMGGEELGQAGSQVASLFMTGSIVAESSVSGANVFAAGSVGADLVFGEVSAKAPYLNATTTGVVCSVGSPYGMGVIVPLTTRTAISGGMFVSASGGLAYAAPASTLWPIGIAVPGTNVASGGTVNVIVHGVAPVVAEGTVAVGCGAIMGAGAALNCVLPATAASGARAFGVLNPAGSEGVTFIVL